MKPLVGEPHFLWKEPRLPDPESSSFMTVSIWYVVEDEKNMTTRDHYLWVWRTKVSIPPWEDVIGLTVPAGMDAIRERLERYDYLSLRGFVAFTATPSNDWAEREKAHRRRWSAWDLKKDRVRRRAGKKANYKKWAKDHPVDSFLAPGVRKGTGL